MPDTPLHFSSRTAWRMAGACAIAACGAQAAAQGGAAGADGASRSLAPVTVSAAANRDPVEKSYRKMIRGMELFDKERATSPGGVLRFRLLPRRADTDMATVTMDVVGDTVDFPVEIAPDRTFTLARNQKALDENAQVIPNRKRMSMTWRTDIRTPGLPPDTRRLGDLRLECRVGMEAGLVSNSRTIVGDLVKAIIDTPSYCDRPAPKYLFFADRPLFSVTLVDGARREVLAVDKLYGGASDDPAFEDDKPYCDCEVLVDRAYTLPLGDRSWPDDTRVEFGYMDGV